MGGANFFLKSNDSTHSASVSSRQLDKWRYTSLKMARNDRNPKRDNIKSRKKFQKLQRRRNMRQSGDGEESVGRVIGETLFYFIRSLASRGLVFFFFCILISLYNIYRK